MKRHWMVVRYDEAGPQKLVSEAKDILTPALAIYTDAVDENIFATLRLVDGQSTRWRPHVKTAKLEATIRQLMDFGIQQFKCATTLELLTVCRAGGKDVLMAYPSIGSHALRVREIASQHPNVRVSIIVENVRDIPVWRGSRIPIFIDVNPGMNRTGVDQYLTTDVIDLACAIQSQGSKFGGLHYYDGHHRQLDLSERQRSAHLGYSQLMILIRELQKENLSPPEVVTSGTPSLPCALTFPEFSTVGTKHTISSGTIVYNDMTSLSQIPSAWGYRLAAFVLTTVVSHPAPGLITCDAGLKSVSVDRGTPHCTVFGFPDFEPLHPSEEHLTIRVPGGVSKPEIGSILHLAPKHVCTTVNNFDHALLITNGAIVDVAPVSARGHEIPLSRKSGDSTGRTS